MEPRNKFDINRLIKIAKENRDDLFSRKISDDLNDATRFCLSFNIKEGGNKVFAGIIYQAYLTVTTERPQSKADFFKDFDELVEPEKSGNSGRTFYRLNYKPGQLVNAANNRKVKTND